MSALTKKHHTNLEKNQGLFCRTEDGDYAKIPRHLVRQYLIKQGTKEQKNAELALRLQGTLPASEVFAKLDAQYTPRGNLLRGTRVREGLTQAEFAVRLQINQPELSKMENGKRPIGRAIAKRIEKEFGVNYRYFLE